jgi:MYXO-CTERM domain-containing protein
VASCDDGRRSTETETDVRASAATAAAAPTATVTVAGPTADTFISSATPNNNNGGYGWLYTGEDFSGGRLRTLVRFALPTGLQGRVLVTDAKLRMTLRASALWGVDVAGTVSVYRVGSAWLEGTGVSSIAPGINEGDGQACTAGASWNLRNCAANTAWTSPGGDGVALSATASTAGLTAGQSVTWESAATATDVQGWIDGVNNGWELVSSTESAGSLMLQGFYSREAGTNAPSLTFTYQCSSSVLTLSGNSCTTCTAAANAACVTAQAGNSCNDPGAPSLSYTCSCGNAAYAVGTGAMSCIDKNECATNHCRDTGDSGATCTDHVAPSTGYDCSCSPGFSFNGISCVSACGNGPDPCGAGTCAPASSGWTCSCGTGYQTSGGAQPTCVNFNACTGAAIADCTAATGNSCVDEAPPSLGYHCACANAAYVPGTGTDGKPACVDHNECNPNHCRDGGDVAASCVDHVAPQVGYDCVCSSAAWGLGTAGGVSSCVAIATGQPDGGRDAAVRDAAGDARADGSGATSGQGGSGGAGGGTSTGTGGSVSTGGHTGGASGAAGGSTGTGGTSGAAGGSANTGGGSGAAGGAANTGGTSGGTGSAANTGGNTGGASGGVGGAANSGGASGGVGGSGAGGAGAAGGGHVAGPDGGESGGTGGMAPPPAGGSGCSCAMSGPTDGPFMAVAIAAIVWLLRRRRRLDPTFPAS